MEDRPGQALDILENIDKDILTTRKARARHALLHSMALDKNYIDVTTDSIIAPAVIYYSRHGNADDKLKTHYYWGRIYQNAGDTENAMKEYIFAEQSIRKATDHIMSGKLYVAKRIIYDNIFEPMNAIRASKSAAEHFLKGQDMQKYLNTLLSLTNEYITIAEKDSTQKYLSLCKQYLDEMTPKQKAHWYSIAITANNALSHSEKAEFLNEYISSVPDSLVLWLNVADEYYKTGDKDNAAAALKMYEKYAEIKDIPAYYIAIADISFADKEYERASEAYRKYIELSDKISLDIFNSDTKYIEEMYKNRLRQQNDENKKLALCLILVIAVLVLIMMSYTIYRITQKRIYENKLLMENSRRLEKEANEYKILYEDIKDELSNLKKIRGNQLPEKNVIRQIDKRLNVLNKFVAAKIVGNYSSKASEELKKLMDDKDDFIESTRLSFVISHPKFIEQLKRQNLSDWEIGCCCLYAIGLRGKDISIYLEKGKDEFYKFSSSLRKKLGLDGYHTNIDKYLRQLLEKYSD